jgi:hypothetical protein
MNRVSAEVSQEVGVLFEHDNVHARPRQQESQHNTGGTASSDATTSLDYIIHANRLDYAVE